MKPETAIAHYKLGKLSSEEIVKLANSWLEQGLFTDSINLIAMETNPIMSDVGPTLEKAITELDMPIPTKVEAAKIAAKDIIERMVSGKIDLMEGATFLYLDIHREVTDDLPDGTYVGTNLGLEHIFCWLREVWDCRDGSRLLYYSDLPREQAKQKFLEHLREESKKWLANHT
ncbi:hypothetical protein SH528x_002949 [Novipirellula sp. SH528]|uniref:hypothetical protein n=1 Tax=Novipirellula sp. SH528 TaxID=3454466 RepID=UPI003F9F228B